jgi:hypothetical protein
MSVSILVVDDEPDVELFRQRFPRDARGYLVVPVIDSAVFV